jgi:hypothetical protein
VQGSSGVPFKVLALDRYSLAKQCKAYVYGRWGAGITASNGCLSFVSVVSCQVEVSASG